MDSPWNGQFQRLELGLCSSPYLGLTAMPSYLDNGILVPLPQFPSLQLGWAGLALSHPGLNTFLRPIDNHCSPPHELTGHLRDGHTTQSHWSSGSRTFAGVPGDVANTEGQSSGSKLLHQHFCYSPLAKANHRAAWSQGVGKQTSPGDGRTAFHL